MSDPLTPPVLPKQVGAVGTAEPPRIGDRLRQARERRGLRIVDVAAALKIRVPILEALEREEHERLPPLVYTHGHLRTYAAYLGLDPATVVAGWALAPTHQFGADTQALRPISGWRERLFGMRPTMIRSTRGLLAIGGLGLGVLAAAALMSLQVVRFLLPPSIAIIYPSDEVSSVRAGTLSVELKGTADANASIIINSTSGAQLATRADESGLWNIIVPLGAGRTEVVAHAVKSGTGGESSATAQRVFIVELPDKTTAEISVLAPVANLLVRDEDVPISLMTTPNSEVSITATNSGGELIAKTATSDTEGRIESSIPLPAGRWTVSFTMLAPDSTLREATRTVDVSYTGVTVGVTGGLVPTWVRVWIDGHIVPSIGVSGKTISPGTRLLFSGSTRIEIRSADVASLLFTLNGRTIDGIGSSNGSETYAFLDSGRVERSSRR